MANRRHVHADLVSAAGLDTDIHQRELAKWRGYALANFIMSNRRATSAAAGGHANAPHHIAADLGIDGAAVFSRPAMHQRHVTLLHLAPRELLAQLAMGHVVLGDDDQPAGVLVETVHDSGAQLAAYIRP